MVLCCFATCVSVCPGARDAAAQEPLRGLAAEVWAAEVRHWDMLLAREWSEYMRLYHRDYLGWPHFSDVPVDKRTLGNTPIEIAEGDVVSFELGSPTVQVFGGAAVAHYFIELGVRRPDGSVNREVVRYSRTWVRVDGDWIIMTESSAMVEVQR